MHVTPAEYLRDRASYTDESGTPQGTGPSLSPELAANMLDLLYKVNCLGKWYTAPTIVSSGYRPASVNAATPGAAAHSAHMTCQAVDLLDPHGLLRDWCLANLARLVACELYMEHPSATGGSLPGVGGWTHLQSRVTRSGIRVFFP